MRRSLALALIGCLFVLGAAPAQARYGYQAPTRPRALDTWLAAGDRVVGRFHVDVSPTPTLTLSMAPGGTRVIAWRVKNVAYAYTIKMTGCHSGSGFGLSYFKPTGEEVSWLVTHDGGYRTTDIPTGTFRTLYVHIHAKRNKAHVSCVLRGERWDASDEVILDVRT
jgi:hypothetical protein